MQIDRRGVIAATILTVVVFGAAFSARTLARAPQATAAPADLVITNGRVVTLEDGMPDAQAVAARAGASSPSARTRRSRSTSARRPR